MSRELVNAICRTFPGAEVSDPWGGGHDAWKVGGKMFACIGAVMPGVSVKTDSIETAQMLIDAGVGVKARHLHHHQIITGSDPQGPCSALSARTSHKGGSPWRRLPSTSGSRRTWRPRSALHLHHSRFLDAVDYDHPC